MHWPAALDIRPELKRVVPIGARYVKRGCRSLIVHRREQRWQRALKLFRPQGKGRTGSPIPNPVQKVRSLATTCKPVEIPCLAAGRSPWRCKPRRAARSRCQCPLLRAVHSPEQARRRQSVPGVLERMAPKHPTSSSFRGTSPGPISTTPLSASANRAPRARRISTARLHLCAAQLPPYPEIFRGDISKSGSASRAD